MVLLDLQKAFDTVGHKILLYKFHALGLDPNAVSLFKLYVSGRTQIVNVNGTQSKNGYFLYCPTGIPALPNLYQVHKKSPKFLFSALCR